MTVFQFIVCAQLKIQIRFFYFAEEVMLAEENKNSGPSALDGEMFDLCCFSLSLSHVDCGMQFLIMCQGQGHVIILNTLVQCTLVHPSKYAFSLYRFHHLSKSCTRASEMLIFDVSGGIILH